MYLNDVTVLQVLPVYPLFLTGNKNELPIGMQIIGKPFEEVSFYLQQMQLNLY